MEHEQNELIENKKAKTSEEGVMSNHINLNFCSMKKKILSGLFALALLLTTGYGVSENLKSDANLSDLALGSTEALAQSEEGGITCSRTCLYTGWCWKFYYTPIIGGNDCYFSGYQYDTCICW